MLPDSTDTFPATATPAQTHRRRIILILGALTAFGPMGIDLYLPAFTSISQELNASLGHVELTISLFLLGLALGQLVYGPMSDRFGRRWPLLVGTVLYVTAAIGCAWTHSIGALMALRLLMAVGGAAGTVIARAVVRDWFEADQAAHLYSMLMLVMGAVPILAPMVGGQLLDLIGWRGLFGVMAAFGVACLIAIVAWLPESLPASRRVQGGLGSVKRNYGKLLRDGRFVRLSLASALTTSTLFAYITGVSGVLMGLHGMSARAFGLSFGANAMGLILGSQANRFLLRRHTSHGILKTGLTLGAIVTLALLVHGITGWGGLPVLAVLLFSTLTLSGVLLPNLTMLVLEPFAEMAGSAAALMGGAQYLVGFVAGSAVSLLHNGTAVPMTAVMAFCCTGSWLLNPKHLKTRG